MLLLRCHFTAAHLSYWTFHLAPAACTVHPGHTFDVPTVLHYLTDSLKRGDSLAVLLLKRIFTCMSGIDGVSRLSSSVWCVLLDSPTSPGNTLCVICIMPSAVVLRLCFPQLVVREMWSSSNPCVLHATLAVCIFIKMLQVPCT